MIAAYPLQWPTGWKRAFQRIDGKFSKTERNYTQHGTFKYQRDLSVADSVQRVLKELERLGVPDRQDIVISTNVPTRLDGLPRSGGAEPADPGAAVYWVDPFTQANRVMAIDQYKTVADNLAAIAATLEAMRAIERHGGAQILERAFTGFTALPAPGQTTKRTWREVFGFDPDRAIDPAVLKAKYRRLAAELHPDREGGSHALMAELNVALAEAEQALGVTA